jgi:hypothetical protein
VYITVNAAEKGFGQLLSALRGLNPNGAATGVRAFPAIAF